MQEPAFVEMAVARPEKRPIFDISREKILARNADKIGQLFLEKKYYSNKWRTEVSKPYVKEEGKVSYDVEIENRSEKKPSRLTLKYEKPSSARLDKRELTTIQLSVDEATKIGLRKKEDGKWEYFRDMMGRQSTQLSSEEISLLNSHLLELRLSLNWERSIDILDPISNLKTITPALIAASTVVAGVYLHQNINEINNRISDYLQKGNVVQQEDHTITLAKEKKPSYPINRLSPSNEKMFQDETLSVRNNFYQQENNMMVMSTLGLIDDLSMTTRFFSQPQLRNGRDFSNTVGKYLMYSQDGNSRYRWRPYENSGKAKNTLVKPLRDVLKAIREDKNPQSQKNYFRMLDAFLHFKGQSIVSPEKIMAQLGQSGDFSYVDGKQLLTDLSNFNDGPIKAYKAYLLTVNPGELLVNVETGQVGIIMNVTKDNKVVVMVVDAKGQSRRVVYDENSFPDSVVFRYP